MTNRRVVLTVEAGTHFGHDHLILHAEGRPTVVISTSDPRGMRELAEWLYRVATEALAGKEEV